MGSGRRRYTVTDEQYEAGGTLLRRGVRESDHRPVLLRIVRNADARDVARLDNELRIASTLDASAVARPLGRDQYEGLPALVLDDFGGRPLEVPDAPMEPGRFLPLAIRISTALEEVHRHAIHKDIKPENILVDESTGRVKITGFGLASPLPREHPSPASPLRLEGTLPYMSPEQTGRMNRTVDCRSDLYSLGITFYQLLTGQLPFDATDPVEWVHCHIARTPPAPSELVPELPRVLSDIVVKLLSKVAEERYQSAAGLRQDLERCLSQWERARFIAPFPLGERDVPDRFPIAQKLYGRERETGVLVGAFERVVATGLPELVMVAGQPGIGKSALIHEVQKPIVRERGFFLSGKFDQYKRNIPYSTIVQAFRRLVLDLLAEPEERLAVWRHELGTALGAAGQVIVDVIPHVELVVGPQAPVPELPLVETQNRFFMVFQRFVGVFARREHPVALFLDDLQWADAPSLRLVEHLVRHPETRYLFVIGAYRDTEVSDAHPLRTMLREVSAAGVGVQTIDLGPLSPAHMRELIADAAHASDESTTALAELVHRKTAGNPFFAIQFLSTLHADGLLAYDVEAARWRWSIEAIFAQGITDNVVELMVAKLRRFPAASQEALETAACIGNSASLSTLTAVMGSTGDAVEQALIEPVREGLILRAGDQLKFLHDRVQQAAYQLSPEPERAAVHLRIGRLLRGSTTDGQLEERIFDIVNQLNKATALLTDPAERAELGALNFLAGRKARASIAYGPAFDFLSTATALLPADAWTARYDDTFSLVLERSECAYLTGRFAEAHALFDELLGRARSHVDSARVYSLLLRLYQVSGRYDEATTVGLEALELFGIRFPDDEAAIEAAFTTEVANVPRLLAGREIAALADAPLITDPEQRMVVRLMAELLPCAYIGRPRLFPLVTLRVVGFCLEHGNTEDSSFAYSAYSIMLVSIFGDIASAYEFSQMSLRLNEKLHDRRLRGTLLHIHGDHINFWRRPIATDFPILEQAFLACLEVGDLVYAGFLAFETVWQVFERGGPLEEVRAVSMRFARFARETNNEPVHQTVRLEQQLVACLRGTTRSPTSFDDETFDEATYLAAVTGASFGCGVVFFHIMKQLVTFLAGQPSASLLSARQAKKTLGAAMAMPIEATHYLLEALAAAAVAPQRSGDEREALLQLVRGHLEKLERWADNCPENYLNRWALVAAELARVEGRDEEAMHLYEQAIQSAGANGFVPNEALAYELAAAFYRARGFDSFSDAYLREARSGYQRWGAEVKVRQLDQAFPHLEERRRLGSPTLALPVERLDLMSIIKASQMLSGEIELARLMRALLQIVLEQGGAQRGCLLLARNGGLTVEAEASLDEKGITVTLEPPQPAGEGAVRAPTSIINYVRRTHERVILDDTRAEAGRFSSDPYFADRRCRSVMCLPIVKQTKLVGVLYLENQLTANAFTSDRLVALELLATQAAISLESALLLVREKEARRTAEAAERREAFLSAASQALAASLDYTTTVAKVAHLLVPDLADWCIVDLSDGEGGFQRVASAHADPAKEALLHELSRYPLKGHRSEIAETALRTGEVQLFPLVGDELLDAMCDDARHAQIIRALGTSTAMAVPLVVPGRTLGLISMAAAAPERHYGPEDVAFASELARRIAAAIDNTMLYRAAKEAIRARDEFLSVASHELKTPLTSLQLSLQGLTQTPPDKLPPALISRLAEIAERQGRRLGRLVDDLLDVTRIEQGRFDLTLEDVDLLQLVSDTVARFDRDLRRAGCPVTVHGTAGVIGRWDRSRLEQVVSNLLSNAMKFGAGKPIEISVGAQPNGGAWLSVRDHGIGIDLGRERRLFERYERAVSAQHYGGLGLGLYICRRIVEAHGGCIRVASRLGEGATFTVELPCVEPHA